MPTLITGRTLDPQGLPIDGTGFEYDSDSRLAELLSQRVTPLASEPITGEWGFGLVASRSTGGAYERAVGIFGPGNAGPPEHFHPIYAEHFEIVDGEFIFRIDGKERAVDVGEKLVVSPGTPHTFRCVGNTPAVFIFETRPAARISQVLFTLFAMAHEGKLTPQGQPKLLQAMVIGSEYADDTVFTTPPPNIAIPIAHALAPIGRMLGYRATYPQYMTESYWRAHVEQPA